MKREVVIILLSVVILGLLSVANAQPGDVHDII